MSNKTVNTYLSAIQFVADRYKTQKICVEAVDTCFLVFDSVSDQWKTRKMSDKLVSNNPFMLKCCLDIYQTQEI